MVRTFETYGDVFKNKDTLFRLLAVFGMALFFANELNVAIFVRIFELIGFGNQTAVWISYFIPFILTIPLLAKRFRQLKVFYWIFGLTLAYFCISMLFNLENLFYFVRPGYGMQKVFLPAGGVFSVYYINLLYDKDSSADLLNGFYLSGLGLFAISALQYIAAFQRGYWLSESSTGEIIQLGYSLTFGVNMAFAMNLLLCIYFCSNKKWLLLPVFIGNFMIFTDGNRMSLVLPFLYVILYFFYLLIQKEKPFKSVALPVLTLLLAVFSVFLFTRYAEKSANKKAEEMTTVHETEAAENSKPDEATNIHAEENTENSQTEKADNEFLGNVSKSRNLDKIFSGKVLESNSRGDIHRLVREGLKKSPFWGLGAFGDRPLVAPKYFWGHSHGIHYEIWSNLGIFLGVPFVLLLMNTFFAFYKKKKGFYNAVYFAFVGTAAIHLTSLSFWLAPYIFSIIGLSILVLDKEDFWAVKIIGKFKNKKASA